MAKTKEVNPWAKAPEEAPQEETQETAQESPVAEVTSEPEAVPEGQVEQPTQEPEIPVAEGEAIVTSPKQFKLRLDHDKERVIPAGVSRLPKELVDHWWVKAHGVVEFKG